MDLSLQQLRALTAVADRRSFTAAAADLHLSQSALSRTVREVEDRLGVQLFRRTTRSVTLTAEGIEVIRIAESVGAAHDRGMRRLEHVLEGTSGAIRIAALPSVAALLIPPLVARFRQEAPDVQIRMHDGLSAYVADLVQTHAVDLALTDDTDPPPELAFQPLTEDRFVAIHRPDHAWAGRRSVPWRELRDQTFVAFTEQSSVRRFTDRAFAVSGRPPRDTVEAQNVAAIAGLVAAGLGVSAVPRFVLPLMRFAGLAHTPLVGPTIAREIGLLWEPGRTRSPAVERFVAMLRRNPLPTVPREPATGGR